jgi:hypothetical protein
MADKKEELPPPATELIDWVNLTSTSESDGAEWHEIWKSTGIDIVGEL